MERRVSSHRPRRRPKRGLHTGAKLTDEAPPPPSASTIGTGTRASPLGVPVAPRCQSILPKLVRRAGARSANKEVGPRSSTPECYIAPTSSTERQSVGPHSGRKPSEWHSRVRCRCCMDGSSILSLHVTRPRVEVPRRIFLSRRGITHFRVRFVSAGGTSTGAKELPSLLAPPT